MMSGMPLETCWAFNKRWNNKFYYKVASCWLFLLIHTAMHGSMNIKVTGVTYLLLWYLHKFLHHTCLEFSTYGYLSWVPDLKVCWIFVIMPDFFHDYFNPQLTKYSPYTWVRFTSFWRHNFPRKFYSRGFIPSTSFWRHNFPGKFYSRGFIPSTSFWRHNMTDF